MPVKGLVRDTADVLGLEMNLMFLDTSHENIDQIYDIAWNVELHSMSLAHLRGKMVTRLHGGHFPELYDMICGNRRYEILANPHLRQRDLKKIINSLI